MATTKFLLDMRYVRQDGKYPLKIQLTGKFRHFFALLFGKMS